ncbi:MAG TPA: peptidoglycan DD-metalloendopeptidase family protein [Xanthobacteraceae bacterium]|nr:peptidoglycan DD-metalloendopeptidase family protein [Xanthobacteraceae bacterium]
MYHRQVSSQPYPGVQYRPAPNPRAQSAAVASPRSGYTLGHAGRQLRVGPIVFWVVVGTLVIMAGWSIVTATYFAFRDDVLTGLIARQAEMQYAYEDRIADLRQQVDRMSSRQLLNQEQYESKLDQIMRRQSALENRANSIQSMPDSIVTGSTRPTGREQTRSVPNRPSPVNDKSSNLLPEPATGRDSNLSNTIARLQASLDRVESRQAASLSSIEAGYEAKAQRIRGVLADLGIAARDNPGVGGPLVRGGYALASADSFEHRVDRVSAARANVDRLTRSLASVPVRRPVMGDPEISSSFGMRIDPFIRAPAMHTGMDFRGDAGDPARATADGTVTIAAWQGGYGKMVEIDHGNGLATRYAHLSEIIVKVGQRVRAGHIVGKVGSTGRSTGPHLHYETRVNGEAVDPRKFLRAGMRLGGTNF